MKVEELDFFIDLAGKRVYQQRKMASKLLLRLSLLSVHLI
ncbi:hypothetical protein QT996_26610 [Microcoleus sp. S13C4]